ncbi:glycosyltransferase family 4 protein [Salinibacter altiplanensis]|uniref:glycosyltransferase family 4 protein n=1 Tax=Salinibacter altiplanensis TaxID=1803181 RepID=UPI000C9F9255|nr:glycosyltransferase family 4 protein [Salinibacter altiplanensis]
MRIGLVIYGDLTQVSGGYLYDRKLVDHLRGRGDEVIVFSQPERPYPLGLVDNLSSSFWARLRASDLDLLLQDELNHASLALGNVWLRRVLDAPIVTIVHHLRAEEQRSALSAAASRILEGLYLRTPDARIYNSRSTKRSAEALADTRPHVIARPSGRRFGPPVSPDHVSERARAGNALRLLFVGNLIPRKRPHLLIEGLARARSTRCTLDIVGDRSADDMYTTTVRQSIDRLDDPSRVTLHGQVPDDDLKELLDASHALAVPSAHEGYGIVYVEAMGRGLPVLASPNGGVRDVVSDGDTGYFVETAEDIAAAIDTWATDREHLAEMGRAAVTRYQETPTWAATCRRIASFLDRIARHSPS